MRPTTGAERVSAADLRQACAELERRLSAGEACSAETLFASHPTLACDDDAALEVIYTEFVTREHLGQNPTPEEYYGRFPLQRAGLEQLFQVHRALGDAQAVAATARSLTPWPDRELRPTCIDSVCDSGRRIGNYEVLEEVGRGGMGVVYKSRQVGLNRIVALKMILTGSDAGPRERARFRTEAEAAARLQHPNIVQVHEVGEHEGRPFLALEYVAGGSLQDRLTGTPWPALQSASLVATLARAMHHAHTQGVIHRDLKPANVLLQIADCRLQIEHVASPVQSAICNLQSAIPKIADFGLARRVPQHETGTPAAPTPTRSGAILGTPAYMAPEQAAPDGHEAGPAADVYALGAILYELLTGRPPFQCANVLETLEQVRTREPLAPSRLLPLPRDVETICLKCLRKEPGRRYANAAELAGDLERFVRGEPVCARPTPAWERAWKWTKRRPAVAALLTALVMVTIVGLTSVTLLWRQTVAALNTAKARQDETAAALATKLVALAHRDWLANDLDQACRHLDECPPDHRAAEWRYLHRVCHACQFALSGPPLQPKVTSLAWSPNGRCLAAAYFGGVTIVWDPHLGGERCTLEANSKLGRVAFDPEGRLVIVKWSALASALPADRLEVSIFEPESGREITAYGVPTTALRQVMLSADGRRLVLIQTGKVSCLGIPGDSEPRTLVNQRMQASLPTLSADGRMWAWQDLKKVGVLDTAGGPLSLRVFPTPHCHSLAFSPDGSRLAIGGHDREKSSGVLSIWEYSGGSEAMTFHGHEDKIECIAFSPDGRRLATGSHDKTVKVWDLDTARELFTFRGHAAPICAMTFSPDDTRLATGAQDGTVRIWDVRPFAAD